VNDFDDLDDLERELGPSLRVALRRAADMVTDDGRTSTPWPTDVAQDEPTFVDLETLAPATTVRRPRRPRLVAAAIVSAAAVVVAGIAVVALSRGDDAEPTDQPIEAVAESFMKAWVRGDGGAVAALMSPRGSVDVWPAETLPALHDWYRAVGSQYRDEGCAVVSVDSVSCDYTVQNDLTRAVGAEPTAGSFLLVIEDGAVSTVTDRTSDTYHDTWQAFVDWVTTYHRDDVGRMFTSDSNYPLVDPASIRLWARYTPEFIGSGAAYTARADAICTAAKARYHDLVAASPENGTVAPEAAARILEEALAELRAVAPPTDVRTRFDHGYARLEQLLEAFRQMAAAGLPPGTTAASTPSQPPSPGELANLLHQIDVSGLGLSGCAFNPSG